MSPRSLGLVLIWLGTIALVAVLMHRVRKGAWDIAIDPPPPIDRWAVPIAAGGLGLALAGTALFMWGGS
ncbi:MAG: hypothetical protein ACM31L_06900 [Actinomycetota bacterium]